MSRRRALVLVTVGLALVVYVATHARIGTDITNFMPDRNRSEFTALSTRLADSAFTRTMVLSVEAPDLDDAVAVAQELATRLRGHPEIAWVRDGIEDERLREVFELYFPRRHALLSEDPEREIPEWLSDEALRERAQSLRLRLASPAATLLEDLASTDPIGAFERVVQRLRQGEPMLARRNGQFVTPDDRFAILLAATRGSAFDSGKQSELLSFIEAGFRETAARRGVEATLEMSGSNRFAISVERRMKRDVYSIGAVSFLGVAALFFAFVGSLRGFLVVSLPPLAGILVATASGLALFGKLDGLTMAFGASLMGIAIDYSNHLLIHQGLAPPGTPPEATARRLRGSLVLGGATTVASLGGMAVTAFPAFREMSFFATVGVCAALVVSLGVVPDLLRFVPPLPSRAAAASVAFTRLTGSLGRLPRSVLFAPLVLAGLGLVVLPRIDWLDDMSGLAYLDPELLAEDGRVRERVGAPEGGYFVVGLAAGPEAALELNDAVDERMRQAIDAGLLERTRSLHPVLWSEELQRRNFAAVRAEPELAARVERAFVAEGFRPGAFAGFGETLVAPDPAPLTLADFEATPLRDLLAPFVFRLGDGVAIVTYLEGVQSLSGVRGVLQGLPGVHLLDQQTFFSDVYREYRRMTLRQLLVGGVLVLGLLVLRYRAWRPTLAAFLPSALVAALLLEGFALAGVRVNLLHVMSLVMVMGMGVDFGIFLVDSAGVRRDLGATMLSLLMSCFTTAFVFGALALSEQPALRSIGVTAGIGILLSYALAPVTVVALGVGSQRKG